MLGSMRALCRHSRRCGSTVLQPSALLSRGFAKPREVGDNKKGEELSERKHQESRTTLTKSSATQSDILPQTFGGDYRSHSGLGLGDNIHNHTDKWFQVDEYYTGNTKPPMQYCEEAPPIKCHGTVVASTGTDDVALGCPVEYISLKGTSREAPAVCKYTGLKYYSEDWMNSTH